MITIIEGKTKKVPGKTSLFINFNYKPEYVNLLKTCSGSSYSKVTKTWEVPVIYLSKLLDSFCEYDSIELTLLKDTRKSKQQEIVLSDYKTKPFEYQLEGIRYGVTHDSWLLLDPPGLGKSLEILYIASELKKRKNLEHCLIVCGLNTLKGNWRKEIEKHTDLTCTVLGEKVTRNEKRRSGSIVERLEQLNNPIKEFFVITNVETLRDARIIKAVNKGVNKFDMIAVDEIHECKNPNSQQGANLLKLTNAKYKIGATGTLLLNNPLDAYLPLKWIGVERSTYTNFKYFYCNFTGEHHNILESYKNMSLLKDMIEENSLRRPKDLLNLPPKTVIKEYVEMDDTQALFYDNIKKGIKDQVDKVKLKTQNVLAIWSRLRQATACPSILTTERISSAKIGRTCDLVEQITSNEEKVVIFSTFKETVYELERLLKDYKPLICTGDIDDDTISKNVDAFQKDPERKVFIATWQKCGTGITLTAASYEIFIDTPWTDAVFTQAQDRCYRIGTKKNLTIYNLITKGTVDEKVSSIVESKAAVSDYMLDDKVTDQTVDILRKYIEDLLL